MRVRLIRTLRWLIDIDRDADGMQVLVDLHGGDPEDLTARAEYNEIRELVHAEVRLLHYLGEHVLIGRENNQRESGVDRSYSTMWSKYKRRVLLAMSSQAFAQLVDIHFWFHLSRTRLNAHSLEWHQRDFILRSSVATLL